MGLLLRYVFQTKFGTWHYRRRVPKAAQAFIPKGEFKRFLGETRREALRNWPRVNAEFERLISPPDDKSNLDTSTPPQPENVQLQSAPLEGRSEPVREPIEEVRRKPSEPTLEDAKRLYVQERVKGDINEIHKAARIERVMGHLHAVIAPDCPLSKLTRKDAREVRDRMLGALEMKPITVKRYLCDVSAMVNLGIREFDVREAVNPFQNLPIKAETTATVAREERDPLPADVVRAMHERLSANAASDIWNLWQILEGTGCRLGEISGLLRSDVYLKEQIPYLDLVFHEHRRLKTVGSIRRVPLIGSALKAVKDALRESEGSTFLFLRYGRVRGADSASAALMKHLRAISENPKHTVHSLRHGMEDKLTRAVIGPHGRV